MSDNFKLLVDTALVSVIPSAVFGLLAGLGSKTLPIIVLILGIIVFITGLFFKEIPYVQFASYFLISFGIMGVFSANHIK